jgi:hypothetical protein
MSIAASVIQFYDIISKSTSLFLLHQQVVRGLPHIIRYDHGREKAPSIVVLKVYPETGSSMYFVLYVRPNATVISIISTPDECPYAWNLLPKGKTFSNDEIVYKSFSFPMFFSDKIHITRAAFTYHHICRNNTNRFCFYDLNYFCLYQPDIKECIALDTILF